MRPDPDLTPFFKIIAPDGSFTRTEYDSQGRVKKEIDQLGKEKEYTYNSSGQLASVMLPAVQNPLNNNASERPTYVYQYNEFGQMSKLIDAANHTTNFGFSSTGQSTSRTLPNGQVESFAYDSRQRQSLHISFEGVYKVTVYDDSAVGGGRVLGYDLFATAADYNAYMTDGADADTLPDGNLASTVKWERIRMTYDAFGRVLTTTHIYASGATAGQPTTTQQTDTWTNTYDALGRLTQEASPTGVIGYEYNDLGRKTRTWAGATGATAATSLSDITYGYDEFGRLKTVTTVRRDGAATSSATTYRYDLQGRPDYTELPNGVVEDYLFDNMDRLDVMRQYASDADNSNLSNNTLKAEYDYSYRADGKRSGMVEKFGTMAPPYTSGAVVSNSYTWTYDDAGRLLSEVLDSSDNTLDQTETYITDLVGNRIRRTLDKTGTANDVTDIYTYDASDRLTAENRYAGLYPTGTPGGSATQTTTYGWTFTQQTSKAAAKPSVSTVTQAMSYGLTGQLEKVITTTQNGSGTVTARTQVQYRYDTAGIRFIAIDTTDTNLGTVAVDGSSTGRVEYLIDHNNFTGYAQTIIETTKNASGQTTNRVSYTFGLDEITQTSSVINPTTGTVTSTATYTFGHDGHGSTRVLFNAAAAIAQIFTYSAYGEMLAIQNSIGAVQALSSNLTNLLYNGEALDSRTGMYNFRARWYTVGNGRFERLDPYGGDLSDPFSFNKYGAVHSNPIQNIDPTGKFSIGGFSVSFSIGSALRGAGAGAAMGALTGGIDSWLGGGSFVEGAKQGAIFGAIFGFVGGGFGGTFATLWGKLSHTAQKFLTVWAARAITALTLFGAGESIYSKGFTSEGILQGGFRLVSGLLSFSALARFGRQLCFTSDTLVHLECKDGRCSKVPINQVQLGDRTYGSNPDANDLRELLGLSRSGWCKIQALSIRGVELQLLRPETWVKQNGLSVGGWRAFSLPGLLPEEDFQVTSIETYTGNCPDSRGVTGILRSTTTESLVAIKLVNGETIKCTPNHRFWCCSRKEFVSASELSEHSLLLSADGSTQAVKQTTLTEPAHAELYNLEVDGESVYCVGEAGVIAHNKYFFDAIEGAAAVRTWREARNLSSRFHPEIAQGNVALAKVNLGGEIDDLIANSSSYSYAGTVKTVPTGSRKFTHRPNVAGRTHQNDSEVKIVENLAARIDSGELRSKGTVAIFSEKPPCASCSYADDLDPGVLQQFSARYPDIELTVTWTGGGSMSIKNGVTTIF